MITAFEGLSLSAFVTPLRSFFVPGRPYEPMRILSPMSFFASPVTVSMPLRSALITEATFWWVWITKPAPGYSL